ncbi:heme/hemin ABC transporter substrate-binding protein [Chitiniphilus eburneus]|uniref:Hemin ABC transporter substrate-binding protein n=1 Tax=Chitiniphilus eburneus TaxID=2571148 RepID=A0A4V5MQP0_9NEIS|nr:ABC transporter substrate-binding protein [Chitiniphilus eburneus]TJZ73298.1 hemin ABC transporter substrate-binding protein [Chitiniphilus eburneus]
MRILKSWLAFAALAVPLLVGAAPAPKRVVVLGGGLTEIAYALGGGPQLVGADQSSIYPPEARQLPKVGYYRTFSVEGVVGLTPDLVLASDQAGPPEAIERLRQLGRRVIVLPSEPTLPALEQRIHGVAAALGLRDDGRALVLRVNDALKPLRGGKAPRTLMVMSRGGNTLEAAGGGTAADAMLKLAGAPNVLARQRGYKALGGEGIAALAPEVIVTTRMSVESLGGADKLLAMPGLAATPAARNKRLVIMDDLLLLGFGPRLPEALVELKAGLSTTGASGKQSGR